MDIYTYFILGIILGVSIAVYFYERNKERAYYNSSIFISERLKRALDDSAKIIYNKIIEQKRELTEEEKDEIIRECYKMKKEEPNKECH